jgi:hypothetical protein
MNNALRTSFPSRRRFTLAAFMLAASAWAGAAPVKVLFVGNSYSFGRVDPVMSYNADKVHDLTAGFYATSAAGTNAWEPHPWGGVAGIFKQFTIDQGLDYEVSLSARNGASLRAHFLNAADPAWDLRGNVASQMWDVVVLQEQSDATLPAGFGKNANPAQFRAYADKFERFIHDGAAQRYTESAMYGGLAACRATGASAGSCDTLRTIAANPNANPATKIYLTGTWARPDMVFAHLETRADPSTACGQPVPRAPARQATLYYPTLAAMSADLHNAVAAQAASNGKYAGVIEVGDAFQRALDAHVAKRAGFFDAAGVRARARADEAMNLWWDDYLHASKYGSYLDALVQFRVITGRDPRTLGANESAARALGIAAADAAALQRIAAGQTAPPAPVTKP